MFIQVLQKWDGLNWDLVQKEKDPRVKGPYEIDQNVMDPIVIGQNWWAQVSWAHNYLFGLKRDAGLLSVLSSNWALILKRNVYQSHKLLDSDYKQIFTYV